MKLRDRFKVAVSAQSGRWTLAASGPGMTTPNYLEMYPIFTTGTALRAAPISWARR